MKKIIIISGLPGSGKSTVAEGIAAKLLLPVFSVDPIESAIIKSGINKSFETGEAKAKESGLVKTTTTQASPNYSW